MELSFAEGDEVAYCGSRYFPAGPAVVADVRVEGDQTEPSYTIRMPGMVGELLVEHGELTAR